METRSLSEIRIRDPYVLVCPPWSWPEAHAQEAGPRYVLYGSTDPNTWEGPGGGFDAWVSDDLEHWRGPSCVFRPPPDFWGTTQFWAPEVHPLDGSSDAQGGGSFVMLASFKAPGRRRAVHVLRARTPLGPFEPDPTPLTPNDWDCLDGTLHRDDQGRAWVLFCHEWLQVGDGRIVAMQVSPDLRAPVGPPTTVLIASEAPWVRMSRHVSIEIGVM